VLVLFDKYDYTTLRSASVVFIDNVRAGTFLAHSVFKGMNTIIVPLLFNYVDRSWAMGVENIFFALNPNIIYPIFGCIFLEVLAVHVLLLFYVMRHTPLMFLSTYVCLPRMLILLVLHEHLIERRRR
jgi:hypothetical protein